MAAIDRLKGFFAILKEATVAQSYSLLRKEGYEQNDNFLFLCFGEFLGLPIPTSYYTLELLPYLVDQLDGWERRMLNRGSIIEEQVGKHEFCC